MSTLLLRSLSLMGLIALAPAASAGVLHVSATLMTGANDGSSWADAFQGSDGLQQALAVAVAGDQIFVGQGTYKATQGTDRKASHRLLSDVEVYGGFMGTESTPSERPAFGTVLSILSGDLLGDDGFGMFDENSFHVVKGSGVNSGALLDGFQIVGGNSNGSGNNDTGGGMLCVNGGAPVLRFCAFDKNRCTFGGGAVYVESSSPTFEDCSFTGGDGGSFGGAFDIAFSTGVTFERCHFEDNTALRAGALEVFSSTGVVVANCTFRANVATGSGSGGGGGAIWIGSGSDTQIVNCTIVENLSTAQSVGGIRVQSSPAVIANCILWGNQGPGGAQGSTNQANGAANVTYSAVEGGNAGAGNVATDPLFVNPSAGDYALSAGSPAIDAGDNTAVPAGITTDIVLNARFVDDPSVADTGVGPAPVVDMGAYERQSAGPVSYCTAGTSAGGCTAMLSATGTASASASTGFSLQAGDVPGQKDGLFFIGTSGRQANSWGNGTSLQCVTPPVARMGLLVGSGTNGACDGSFAQDLNARWTAQPAQNPGAGALVQAQLWYRDPFNTSNQTTSLSDALEFTVAP